MATSDLANHFDRNHLIAQMGLLALFITSLVVAQLIAVKILELPAPDWMIGIGEEILVPAGVLAYALTFVASDCYTELYGRRSAQIMVNIGFLMNFVMLALVWLAIGAPGSGVGVDPDEFEAVLAPSTNIVLASLAAFLVSQNWDVIVFDRLRKRTAGRHLWLRNIGSTLTSQLIDTVIFIIIAFALAPSILGVGVALPQTEIIALIIGHYLIKLGIAILETPLVYGIVHLVRTKTATPV